MAVRPAPPPPAPTRLGRAFGWLWAAYAVSAAGTWIAFDAFPIVAIITLDAGPAEVSALAAAGLAIAAVLAVPLGPWVERRRKRPVMVAMDLVRFGALLTVPLTYMLGWLTVWQLLVVSVVVSAADVAFRAASGAFLKGLVGPGEGLLVANGRFEATTWTATAIGPPAGGAAIGVLGAATTVVVNAVSFLGSALMLRAIGPDREAEPPAAARALHRSDLLDGWRFILGHPTLRPLFFNQLLVGGLIMATTPPMAVLMLGELGFSPLEYGLAFGAPCLGGLLGARLSRRAVARLGAGRVLRVFGTLRACWSIGLPFVFAGAGGLVLVLVLQTGLVFCMGIFNPVYATLRLRATPDDRIARMLAAWTTSSTATIAALTALWGLLAAATSARAAIATAGGLLLLTPLLLRQLAVVEVDAAK
ncbi:MFS transporter [Baekduia sp. Peel2402]|uniref:MFS transporter n=1 Tax=Baekduia sp. Peel2402 TaxID=3458296 RepID=UPI00403EAB26